MMRKLLSIVVAFAFLIASIHAPARAWYSDGGGQLQGFWVGGSCTVTTLTITELGNGLSSTSNASVATGSTITASVGDWLVVFISADNAGTSGASSISSVTDSGGVNSYTQRAVVNLTPGSAAGDGVTVGIFTSQLTSALSSNTVSANFSPNTQYKIVNVFRVQPGASNAVQFVAADTTGTTGAASSTVTGTTVSVTNGDTIWGVGGSEDNPTWTGDSDTTNGSWSAAVQYTSSSAGGSATDVSLASQRKTVNATGNQTWNATTSAARDWATSYLILRPVCP